MNGADHLNGKQEPTLSTSLFLRCALAEVNLHFGLQLGKEDLGSLATAACGRQCLPASEPTCAIQHSILTYPNDTSLKREPAFRIIPSKSDSNTKNTLSQGGARKSGVTRGWQLSSGLPTAGAPAPQTLVPTHMQLAGPEPRQGGLVGKVFFFLALSLSLSAFPNSH